MSFCFRKSKFVVAAVIFAAPILSNSIVRAQLPILPDVKLEPLPETRVSITQWNIEGGRQSTQAEDVLAQEGKTPLTARLVLPKDTNYCIAGDLLLPASGGSLAVTVGASEAQNADGTKTPASSATLSRVNDELRIGREIVMKEEGAKWATTLTPFLIERLNNVVRITFLRNEQVQTLPAADAITLNLRGTAQVLNLETSTFPAIPKLLTPVAFDSIANTRMLPSPVQTGLRIAGEVPFNLGHELELPALDIKPSLSGWDDTKVRSVKNYIRAGTKTRGGVVTPTFNRVMFNVPAHDYSAIHLLAYSRNEENTVPRMTVRLGYMGNASGILEDRVVNVPTWYAGGGNASEYVVARTPADFGDGSRGHIYHLRVPLEKSGNLKGLAGPNRQFQVEFTRDVKLRMPGGDYGMSPIGAPSGVFVLAATMERTPVEMEYSTAEAGNIFHDTQRVVFQTKVTNHSEKPVSGRVFLRANGPGTLDEVTIPKKDWNAASEYSLQPGESKTIPLDVTPDRRGWYRASVGVEAGGEVVQQRDTSFAVLAPDTRKAMDDSPFGVWNFWQSHTTTSDPNRTDKLASITNKGGWRWTYGGSPAPRGSAPEEAANVLHELKDKYKLTLTIQSPPQAYQRAEGWYDAAKFQEEVVPWIENAKKRGVDNTYKVLHESRSSMTLLRRISEFLGGEPYDMPVAEREKLEKQFVNVKLYTEALRKSAPDAKIVLINDYAAVAEQYLRRGFPKENFDVIGLESANFMREPERQPDWLSLLGTLAQIRRIQEKYGYDKPVWTTEALYHATNPGNLSYHQQGVIYVREAMLALANGVQRMAAAGTLADSSDDYYWSNWGGAGFTERDPEYNPKPSYAMYAWLTQILDQAKYSAHLDTGSTVLHVLDFAKPDNSHVYPVWTVRGRQSLTLQTQGGVPIVYDVYGNPIAVADANGRITLDVTDTPQYVSGTTVTGIVDRVPVEVPREVGQVVLEFDNVAQFRTVDEPSPGLEASWADKFVKGNFATSIEQEDGLSTLRVELQDDDNPHKLLPRYVELALNQPIEFKNMRPAFFNVRLKGNGGWGRVMFEIEDAANRKWTSSGSVGGANSNDTEGLSYVSFDDWHTIQMPLPGQYASPDQFVFWPHNFNWWPSTPATGEETPAANINPGAVAYPIKLTKIIVSMRPNMLYVNSEIPTKSRVLYLDKLGVIDAPPQM